MNPTSEYELTIIIPLYNEVENLPRLEERLSSFLPSCICKACVLFVDDGSSDGSGTAVREICSRHRDFYYIAFSCNEGLSAALKAGIDYTGSAYVGYIDADLHIRASRKDSVFKRIQSGIANGFRRMMTHDGALDTGCPLKVLHTDCAKRLPLFKGMHRFIPALVLLQGGATYMQIPVRHFPRVAGKSKYSLWNRLLGPFADCFAYRWMKSRYINYSVSSTDLVQDSHDTGYLTGKMS